ncbi:MULTISPECIES: efflux RND transporter periplasmic adaptor subunit [Xanthomonas]|nr:efflux RND transporter periplasmic adaptor subunit [Xanthomonas surreyensis]MBD7924610.1 efflux RND transporter periplasmic adaptor subunit [Xanthomonas surreyensis]
MIYAVTLLGTGLVLGLLLSGRPAKSAVTTNQATPPLTVSIVKPQRKALAEAVSVVGATRSRENVPVIPQLSGLQVQRVEAEVGDYVKAGQVLAVLDGKGMGISSNELRSDFERAQGDYERMRLLLPQQLVSVESFKQKQADFEGARARYENARLSVQRTSVVAPAAGFVYRRTAEIGNLTSDSVALFEIAKDGEMEMDASVPEAVVVRLKPGMSASVKLAGHAEPISGEIRLITPNVDSTTRSSEVRIRLHTQDVVPVGIFAQARIDLAQVEGWTIPRTAMQQDSLGSYVWRVGDKGLVSRMPITPTLQTVDEVVVSESLGDLRIVAKAGPFLREKDKVLIADASR